MAKVGRPPLYNNCLDLDSMCEMYIETCEETAKTYKWIDKRGNYQEKVLSKIPTITGLALFLGFTSVDSLLNYGKETQKNEEYNQIITRAKQKCGDILNDMALLGLVEPRIAALNLSANHGMTEKKALDITTDGPGASQEAQKEIDTISQEISSRKLAGLQTVQMDDEPDTIH